MKKLVSSFLMLTALLAGTNAMARNVSLEEAKTAAAAYLRANTDYSRVSADELVLVHQVDNEELGIPAGYFFNVSDWGFIIMSASTAMDPVIGYSYCGNMDINNLPPAMVDWVGGWMNMAKDVQKGDAEKGFEDTDEWTMLLSGVDMPATKANDVILMNEQWDQGDASGADYNMLCPVVGGEYCYTGCVATALAQLCHYYKFPVNPKNTRNYTTTTNHINIRVKFDTVNFDYSKMPNRIVNSTSQEKRLEISKLGYMVGVAVGMNYGSYSHGGGSSAHSEDVPGCMFRYFKYQRGNLMYRRASFPHEAFGTSSGQTMYYDDLLNYSPYNNAVDDETYMSAIRSDLLLNRPVYMGGISSQGGSDRDAGGHAFLVCGYRTNSENMYYFNWGWGGTVNGFYNLGNNNMSLQYSLGNYNRVQEAIVGIIPPHADSSDVNFLGISDVEPTAVEFAPAYPNPASYSVNIPSHLNSAADMFIYSMDGRLVEQRHLEAGEDEVEVRVDRMPAGIYVYRVNGVSGKFIVQ